MWWNRSAEVNDTNLTCGTIESCIVFEDHDLSASDHLHVVGTLVLDLHRSLELVSSCSCCASLGCFYEPWKAISEGEREGSYWPYPSDTAKKLKWHKRTRWIYGSDNILCLLIIFLTWNSLLLNKQNPQFFAYRVVYYVMNLLLYSSLWESLIFMYQFLNIISNNNHRVEVA